MNRILVIGYGSIGKRHIQALSSIGEDNIAAYRTGKGHEAGDALPNVSHVFYDLDKAYAWNPTHIIISNPTSLHIDFVIKAIEMGIHFFVEKPLCSSYSDINRIPKDISYFGVVGYNLRFHGLFVKIKELIKSGNFGKLLSATFFVGHYLPFWHPDQNYAVRYEARRDLGGGVLRTLSHEIDLAQHFCGKIATLFAKVNRISALELTVDDHVDILAQSVNGVHIKIHQDFLNPVVRRTGEFLFEKGLLEYNFVESTIHFTSYQDKIRTCIYSEKELYNKQYELQMKHFLNGNDDLACTLIEEIENMKVIKYSELSTEKSIEVCLD